MLRSICSSLRLISRGELSASVNDLLFGVDEDDSNTRMNLAPLFIVSCCRMNSETLNMSVCCVASDDSNS